VIRVGIVNDLAVACEALRRVVVGEPGMSVAWIARDGAEAVECARRDRPDIILMDLIMPRMDGVESPCPILVVTATVTGNAALVYEALGAGALDAVNTPTFGADARLSGAEALVCRMWRVERMHAPRASLPERAEAPAPAKAGLPQIVAVGASTGGPRAVADLLRGLPARLDCAVVVVQHVSAPFMQGFVEWLASETGRRVTIARSGDRLREGDIVVAGEERHLAVEPGGTLSYREDPADHAHRPSVDELFASLASYPRPGVAVLLTGMGRDGAEGLLRLRKSGWHTIAQDEATSVVWGMPGAACKAGAAAELLPIGAIAARVEAALTASRKARSGS
jgi:two-component system, chemotaxis family, response regulator WspF